MQKCPCTLSQGDIGEPGRKGPPGGFGPRVSGQYA